MAETVCKYLFEKNKEEQCEVPFYLHCPPSTCLL